MVDIKNKLNIANLYTPIEKIENLSKIFNKNIYIKRDDYTGSEISGNKIRKLEYSIYFAIENGYDTIVTIGSIQSNHARATAVMCAKKGLDCYLILEGNSNDSFEGNYFFNNLLGANVIFVPPHTPAKDVMENVKKQLLEKEIRYLQSP